MFSSLWPRFDPSEVPITSITNGVHAPTWMSREVLSIAEREVGPEAIADGTPWTAIDRVADSELWGIRHELRDRLVNEIRPRIRASAPSAAWRRRRRRLTTPHAVASVFSSHACMARLAATRPP